MTPFQKSLDRYLTSEPPDDTWWFEECSDKLDPIFDVTDRSTERKVEKWMEYLFRKNYNTEEASKLINKTFTHNESNHPQDKEPAIQV